MADTDLSPKTIVVTSATGKQGRAFIKAAVASTTNFHIVAVTRDINSPISKSLASDRVQTVQGDLDDVDSIRQIFRSATEKSNIWGVLCILPFPGLGEDTSGEERQGIALANLAAEFHVKHFIYSSAERGGETSHGGSKAAIEQHIQSMNGLRWTIVRPVFFMENFVGAIGSITATVLKVGLKKNIKVQLVTAEDIGHVTCAVFEQSTDQHIFKIIPIVGDVLTMQEQNDAYKRATNKSMSPLPSVVGHIVLRLNANVRALITDIERIYEARNAEAGYYDRVLAQTHELYPNMHSFEAWAKTGGQGNGDARKWNNVSVLDLILGKR